MIDFIKEKLSNHDDEIYNLDIFIIKIDDGDAIIPIGTSDDPKGISDTSCEIVVFKEENNLVLDMSTVALKSLLKKNFKKLKKTFVNNYSCMVVRFSFEELQKEYELFTSS